MITTKIQNLTEMLKKLNEQKVKEIRAGNHASANALASVQMDIEAKLLELTGKREQSLKVFA